MNFEKATIPSLMTYLEDLEAEASFHKVSLKDYLQKKSNKIPMPIYKILYNTVLEVESKSFKINGKVVLSENQNLVESTQVIYPGSGFIKDIKDLKNKNELDKWLNDQIVFEFKGFNKDKGCRIVPRELLESDFDGEYFDWNYKTELLTIEDNSARSYKLSTDFDAIGLHNAIEVYLLRRYKDIYQVVDTIKLYQKIEL